MKSKTEVHKEMDIISNGMHILYFYHFTILVHLHFAIGLLRGEVAKGYSFFVRYYCFHQKPMIFEPLLPGVAQKLFCGGVVKVTCSRSLLTKKNTQWDLDWNIQWAHNPFIVTVKTSQYHSKSELYKNFMQLRFCSSHDSYIHIIN